MASMRFFRKTTLVSIALVMSLAAILAVLAVLQYRWSGEVSQAERQRMQAGLVASVSQFRAQFSNELQQLALLSQRNEALLLSRNWQQYAVSSEELLSSSSAYLVAGIYLWVVQADTGSELLKLNPRARAFEPVKWPQPLEAVKERYDRSFSDPMSPSPDFRPFPWTMLFRIPLLIHPLVASEPPMGRFIGYLLIELNMERIRQQLLPDLAQRYFGGPDGFTYQISIVSGRDPGMIVYQSDSRPAPSALASPDARASLLGDPRGNFGRGGPAGLEEMRPAGPENLPPPGFPIGSGGAMQGRGLGPPPERMARGPDRPSNGNWLRSGAPSPPRGRGTGPVYPGGDGDWELIARHREGSLEAAVVALRRRNLAISFGILLLLAGSMALIVASARRMQWLARLQLDFVTRVTHELKTPLAVICSAGDNLADGIATARQQVQQYGELIRNQGWKLTSMVEQILQFARIQNGRGSRYSLRPLRVEEVAEAALAQAQPTIAAGGFSVEKRFATNLPTVNADPAALSQAIQNLIQNAVKYSGESRWLGLRIGTARGKHGTEVEIVIEDRGIGIDPADLTHIFDPFYRGRAAKAAEIHGTGLGLFMVREAVVAMGGKIRAESTAGRGSAFTIFFPAMETSEDHPAISAESSSE